MAEGNGPVLMSEGGKDGYPPNHGGSRARLHEGEVALPSRLPRLYTSHVLARRAAALCLFVSACGRTYDCPGNCPDGQPAIFDLSCGPTDLASVALSGPCFVADASPSNYLFGPASKSVAIRSPSPGTCHVVLTFATGFTYSADVTFTLQADTAPPVARDAHRTRSPPRACSQSTTRALPVRMPMLTDNLRFIRHFARSVGRRSRFARLA